jgi:hypothetical protein
MNRAADIPQSGIPKIFSRPCSARMHETSTTKRIEVITAVSSQYLLFLIHPSKV